MLRSLNVKPRWTNLDRCFTIDALRRSERPDST